MGRWPDSRESKEYQRRVATPGALLSALVSRRLPTVAGVGLLFPEEEGRRGGSVRFCARIPGRFNAAWPQQLVAGATRLARPLSVLLALQNEDVGGATLSPGQPPF